MTNFYASYPITGGGVPTYTNLAAFPDPVAQGNGTLAIALDTNFMYESNGSVWELIATPTVANAITALTGDVTATGPGSVPATVAKIQGKTVSGTTGTTNVVFSTSPTLVTPALGTPSAAVLTNATGLPLTTGVTGVLPVANGGTNSSTSLNNNRVMQSSGGAVVEAAAITASRALASDANGIPVASTTTATELGFVNGVTSSIQTQLNGKQATGNYITALTGDVTASGPGSVASTVAKIQGTVVGGTTGSSNVVFSTSPTLVTPALGTPASGVLTSCTGLPLTTGVTGTLPVANGGTGVTASTGTVAVVLSTSPTLVTPLLGTPTSGVLTNCTGLPLTTGVTGTLAVANGGTGVTSVTISPTATAFAGWDSNSNISSNNFLVVGATGSDADTTLTIASSSIQTITPTANRTYTLPTTSVVAGATYTFVNNSTVSSSDFRILINSSAGSLVRTVWAQTVAVVVALKNTPTAATDWMCITPGISNWTPFTPTVTSVTGTKTAWYRRVGDTLQVQLKVSLTSSVSGGITTTLPLSLAIDTNKASNSTVSTLFGNATGNAAGSSVNYHLSTIVWASSTTLQILDVSVGNTWSASVPATWANGDFFCLEYSVPVTAWSATGG